MISFPDANVNEHRLSPANLPARACIESTESFTKRSFDTERSPK